MTVRTRLEAERRTRAPQCCDLPSEAHNRMRRPNAICGRTRMLVSHDVFVYVQLQMFDEHPKRGFYF